MGLFSSQQSYLGIDFDSNSIKLVELKNEAGRPRLVTYGYFDREVSPEANNRTDDYSEDTSKLIKQVCAKARTTTTKVITALPAYSVFSSILNLPALARKDLANAVKWEAKKVIPLPIDEMILDWKILENFNGDNLKKPKSQNVDNNDLEDKDLEPKKFLKISSKAKKENVKVLLTAAPKDLVKRYMNIFHSSGLNLLSLDTESFALIRSLVGNDRSALMIVDIGSIVTNISVVVNNIPILNRSIDVGGVTITKAIANSLNVNLARAEQFKYDIGMSSDRVGQGSVPKTIETTLSPIIDELRYSLELYRNQGAKDIEKIILTGGSSLLLNLPQYLSNLLGLRVFLGDPWARIIYPEELKPVLDEIGPRFAVAAGLAMRDIE
ncbi:MAG: pilus assembly protein PilM [Patescibacteria group bacterium]|jgi:type IV pilus assembly protein PilM|nr:pilus assembly protein PilM [Patescibacteria group bacterium]